MMKIKKSGIVIISMFFLGSIVLGLFLGWSVSETRNIINSEYITDLILRCLQNFLILMAKLLLSSHLMKSVKSLLTTDCLSR